MSIELQEVKTKKDLLAFIKFQFKLYKGNAYYVPPLIDFELSTFLKHKNPAFDHSDAQCWLAKKDGKIVGRIAGIVLNQELKEKSMVRFGWVDFIDDKEVSSALFNTVGEWGKELGAKKLHGPLGFTDLDFEGALISGFDQLQTQVAIYNYEYYIEHYEDYGFKGVADWVEIRGPVPETMPEKIPRIAALIEQRSGIRVKKFKNSKQLKPYAYKLLEIVNDTYQDLYGFYTLTKKQIDYYVDQYFGFVRTEFACIVENEQGEVVAAALCVPSLSKAMQKAKGRLFPFGFIHILRGFYANDHVDMLLIGIDKKHQRLGASALVFNDLNSTFMKKGVKYVSTGPMLETNHDVLSLWNDYMEGFDEISIRRRCYIRDIE